MNNSYSYPTGYSGSNYVYFPNYSNQGSKPVNDDRLIGAGFAFPFLLGGVTGAAIAPAFWRPPYNDLMDLIMVHIMDHIRIDHFKKSFRSFIFLFYFI